jgi:CRP-like cAMP-binding protein
VTVPFKLVPRRDRKLYRLVKRGAIIRLEKGDLLYGEGEPATDLYLVKGGHIRLLETPGADGQTTNEAQPRVAALMGPWEVLGEEALREGTRRRFRAEAGEPAQVTVLDGPGTRRGIQTSRRSFEAFLRDKEAEWELARVMAEARRPGGAARRVGALLMDLAARFGRDGTGPGSLIPILLTHQVLADLSFSHRSTVTTLLNDWIYSEILADEAAGLRILRPDALGGGASRRRLR